MNSRYLAVASLAVMASGFLVTLFLPENTLVLFLRGGFEAGLVGGIADWFAVTALFRHPFGIPIPHTSLLLKNRDKIIRSLISAMENELLNKESIEAKLRKYQVLRIAFSLVTKMLGRRTVRKGLLDFLIQLVRRLPLQQMVPSLQSGIAGYIRHMDAAGTAETAVTKVLQAGYDQKAFDYALTEALGWVQRPDTKVLLGNIAVEKIGGVKAGGLMGFAVQAFAGLMSEEKLGQMLQDMLVSAGNDLLDPDNANRERLLQEVRVRLFELAGDDERMGKWQEWAARQVEGQGGEAFLQERLEEIRGFIVEKLEASQARGGREIFAVYRSVVRSMKQEPEWVEAAQDRFLKYLIELVESNHYRIGQLVKENLDKMDDASLVLMLEEKIGEDLQWIRVNGALCGFVIGLLLALFQWGSH